MNSIVKHIQEKYDTGKLSECIEGLELAGNAIGNLVDISVKLLSNKNLDTFLIVERMSLFFDSYLKTLNDFADSEDNELKFWASTLLCHYNVNNSKAVDFLINEVKYGNIEKAQISTTILARNKNQALRDAIVIRLEQKEDLDGESIKFFERKKSELE